MSPIYASRAEAMPDARRIASAVCELAGCAEAFCKYMRDGSYDDHREVQSALAALMFRPQAKHVAIVPDQQVAA